MITKEEFLEAVEGSKWDTCFTVNEFRNAGLADAIRDSFRSEWK